MKSFKKMIAFFVCLVLGMAFFSATASAYIDPSAMTYIVQVIVGVIVVGGATFGFYFNKIKRAIRKKNEKNVDAVVSVDTEEIDDNGEFDDFELAEE